MMAEEIVQHDPESLEPHPLNEDIYADRTDLPDQFLDSIEEQGVLEPVVVDSEGTIISGHRRVTAATELGLDHVPVRVETYDSDLEKRAALIHYNRQREKTFSQRMREAEVLEEVERERAKERQGDRTDLRENSPGGDDDYGRTREKVGEEVGIGSGRTYDKAREVWEAAKEGDVVAQHEVDRLDRGEQSVHGAYQKVADRRNGDRGDKEDPDDSGNSETLDPDELVLSAHVGTNEDVFPEVLDLHVPEEATVADVTYGNGTFWKQVPSSKYELLATDIDPKKSPSRDDGIDCRDLPYDDASIDCVVLDPPYAEGFYNGDREETDHWIKERYASGSDGELTYHEAVVQLYRDAGEEAFRVLRDDGVLIAKVQDEVSRNEQRLTHIEVTNYYENELGFVAEDLFVLVRPDTPISANTKRQRRARKNHSYFMVYEKRR